MRPIREHDYNAVMIHGLDDEWGATYPSEFFPFAAHRNYKPDTLEKIIQTCHAEGVKVIVYAPCVMFTDDPKYIDGARMKKGDIASEGAITTISRKKQASLDSPFRDLLVGALKEICALGADGLWTRWLFYGTPQPAWQGIHSWSDCF